MMNNFKFDNMNKNNFASTISAEYIDNLDKERAETMSTKEFNDWCKELRVSASYIKKDVLTDNASNMMNMINREKWIATFERVNKTNN